MDFDWDDLGLNLDTSYIIHALIFWTVIGNNNTHHDIWK